MYYKFAFRFSAGLLVSHIRWLTINIDETYLLDYDPQEGKTRWPIFKIYSFLLVFENSEK